MNIQNTPNYFKTLDIYFCALLLSKGIVMDSVNNIHPNGLTFTFIVNTKFEEFMEKYINHNVSL